MNGYSSNSKEKEQVGRKARRTAFCCGLLSLLLPVCFLGRACASDTLALAMTGLQEAYRESRRFQEESLSLAQARFCDSLFRRARAGKDSLALAQAYLCKGDCRFREDGYASAYMLYDTAIQLAERQESSEAAYMLLCGLYLRQGETAYFLGKYLAGVEYLYKLLLSESSLDPAVRMQACIRLGNLFIRLGKNDLAIRYLDEAHRLQSDLEDCDSLPPASFPVWQSFDYVSYKSRNPEKWPVEELAADLDFALNLSYSSAYWQKRELEKSFRYIEKARKSAPVRKLSQVYQNISLHYMLAGDMAQCERYCLLALEMAGSLYEEAVILNNYAIILLEQGKADSALNVCKENMSRTSGSEMYHVRSNLYYVLARIYETKGMYKEALDARQREQAIWDSVYDQEKEEKIWQLNNSFAINKILRDKELLEYQLRLSEVEGSRKNILLVLFSLLSCIVIVLIAVIVKKLQKQRASVSHLEEQIVHIHEDTQKIMESSKAEYENVLTSKAQELTANTMYIAKMCDMANQILTEVRKLESFCTKKEAKELLLNIQRQVASLTIEERGWNDFKLYFEQIHPSFFAKLNHSYPGLTAGENRLCAFIVMNLTTKEISALTNRSVRTIETAKFRLRKKLGIGKEQTTLSFLMRFTNSPA